MARIDAFGYFSRRRKRESALPPDALAELSAGDAAEPTASASDHPAASPEADDGDAGRVTEAPGSDAAELGELLRRAATTGLPQVTTETHTVDLQAGGLAAEIAEALGVDPDPDPDDQPDTASR